MSKSKITQINISNSNLNKMLHCLSAPVEFGGTIIGNIENGVLTNTLVVESSYGNTPNDCKVPILTGHIGDSLVIWHTHPSGGPLSDKDIKTAKDLNADVLLVLINKGEGYVLDTFPKGVTINVWTPKRAETTLKN